MNKIMKKIIGGIVAIVALALPVVSFAATLNNDPLDFATLRVMNYTTNPTCSTCWATTATANAGDVLSFAIYYHNVGPDIATNVRVTFSPQTTVAGTAHTFTATVRADNAPAVTGTVTVMTTTSQTLSFSPNSVIWRPNQQTAGATALPGAQLHTDLFNGVGINLGNIAPGWATQGSVVVRFQTTATTGGAISIPTVNTSSASATSQTSATLNGFVTPNGASTNAWFEWGSTPTYGMSTTAINYGTTATSFSNVITGLAVNTTYYFRAVAQNSQGIVYGTQMSFVTGVSSWTVVSVSTRNADVSTDLAILNGYVDPNFTNDTVRWFEWGTSTSLGNTTTILSHGSIASNFNATITGLSSNTNYYYRAVARNSQGTIYGNILSFTTTGTTGGVITSTTGSVPAATTLLATDLTGTTAVFNGLVFTSSNQPSNAWFEWGASTLLGNKTQTISVGALPTIRHSDNITGLVRGQTYYYRIVAENPYGRVYGSTMSFVSEGSSVVATTGTVDTGVVITTPRPVVTKPTVTVVNSGSSTQSLVSLSVDGGAEAITENEKRSYYVTWKNESSQSLRNVVLRVTFPQTMNFESSTVGTFSPADNTVTIDLGALASGDTGEAFFIATTDRAIKNGDLLVVTANMVYTDTKGVQGDAIAYKTHRVEASASALGASIFGAGSFLPTTLFGWMLLIALVLVLVLLGNHLYGRFSDTHASH
ncbi:MAG: hypothetical protein UV86_C0015G0010 [Candidatus Nomurabacteria bacterium GW2011_GWB1_43_20]|nr:MAG: hypothetical protein UV86_C0015G0010 [Candidatus Nomurabacteria bacterium GW2011_GWB1_43_20]